MCLAYLRHVRLTRAAESRLGLDFFASAVGSYFSPTPGYTPERQA